jgi:uncharacterized membrane protein
MQRTVLRSMAAILAGWIASFVGAAVTLSVIATLHPEPFTSTEPYGVGWLLVLLLVSGVHDAVGGFVTAAIARRDEVKHGIGLVVFTIAIALCFLSLHKDATKTPTWYPTVFLTLIVPSTLFGVWLRMRQPILIGKVPPSVLRALSDLRLSIAVSVDHFRFPIAAVVSVVTFLAGVYVGMLLSGGWLLVSRRFFGQGRGDDVAIPACLLLSILLSVLLARYIYRKIMTPDASLLRD